MFDVDDTHDPALRSWVQSANVQGGDFPIQNLPHGVFRRRGRAEQWRGGVAIGDQVLDLAAIPSAGVDDLVGAALAAASDASLNGFMAQGTASRAALRRWLSGLLSSGSQPLTEILVPQADCEFRLPATIGDYSDFFVSYPHVVTSGKLHRPNNPMPPNYFHHPIGYHGRASTIVVSGSAVRRPRGQSREGGRQDPVFGPSRLVDYEAELGFYVGAGNRHGEPIPFDRIHEHMFGVSILNDWSARDLQVWEAQPAGPLLSKDFATSMSPWIVTMEALAPFRGPHRRPEQGPAPLPHLSDARDQAKGALGISVSVYLRTAQDRREGRAATRLSTTSFAGHYWTIGQIFTHHASNGCALRPGDVIAGGTISDEGGDVGSLLELTLRGARPIALPAGETRAFLEDGDEIIMTARCAREGFVSIGFGECRGELLPAFA
jgi:fumarylacetoacetase